MKKIIAMAIDEAQQSAVRYHWACRLPSDDAAKLLEAMSKFAQAQAPGIMDEKSMEAEEALADLQEFLMNWMNINVPKHPGSMQFVSQVVGNLRSALQKSMSTRPSLEEQLKSVPKVSPSGRQPSQEGTVMPSDVTLAPQVRVRNQDMDDSSLAKEARELADLADKAEAAGKMDEAEKLDEAIRQLAMVKVAQYEGFQHYWIMNGRAFEKSWKEKRKKKGDDLQYHFMDKDYYRSAQECWWETLEEYQESLFGKQGEWLDKYASKKKEKEKEEADCNVGTGGSMSGRMKDFHDEKKGDDDASEGKKWTQWLDEQNKRAAAEMLLTRIARKINDGSSPGVALYEAIDEMVSGEIAEHIMSEVGEAKREAVASLMQQKN